MQKNTPITKLAELYDEIQIAYDKTAELLDFSCQGCPDNCCNSYFLHHTYIEWVYLRMGLAGLSQEKQYEYMSRAEEYEKSTAIKDAEHRPLIMCPLNDDGRCGLYHHRLLICRLHGVPSSMTFPNGQRRSFPGCFRCQEITAKLPNVTAMDRTLFFNKMLNLEREFIGDDLAAMPKVKMTLAQMIITPLPKFSD